MGSSLRDFKFFLIRGKIRDAVPDTVPGDLGPWWGRRRAQPGDLAPNIQRPDLIELNIQVLPEHSERSYGQH